jgi:hypothetical protein
VPVFRLASLRNSNQNSVDQPDRPSPVNPYSQAEKMPYRNLSNLNNLHRKISRFPQNTTKTFTSWTQYIEGECFFSSSRFLYCSNSGVLMTTHLTPSFPTPPDQTPEKNSPETGKNGTFRDMDCVATPGHEKFRAPNRLPETFPDIDLNNRLSSARCHRLPQRSEAFTIAHTICPCVVMENSLKNEDRSRESQTRNRINGTFWDIPRHP